MTKKFYISLFTLVFFLSTTVFPLSIHVCKVVGNIPVEECGMNSGKDNDSCSCKTKKNNYPVTIKDYNSFNCCTKGIIDKTVKDNFMSAKHGKESNPDKLVVTVILQGEIFSKSKNHFFTEADNFPDYPVTNKIYLLNSVLLI